MSAPACERVRATLRLQFHRGFTLDDARAQVPYFAALGVSHLYASPLLASQPGSTHGYDGIAHDRIDPELGGEPALRALVAALRGHGMGLLLDIVPNHMAASLDNPWWHDVLELGQRSEFADWFDIAWDEGGSQLLLPWLPAPLADLVQEADLALRWDGDDGRIHVHAGSARVPLGAASYATVLAGGGPVLAQLAPCFAAADGRSAFDAARAGLAAALDADATLHAALEAALERFLPVDADGRARLRALLAAQPWRLADWRAAPRRINWRRFFDIGALVALRVERPDVFEAVHAYPLALFGEGLVDGLRIDHVDGLRDPAGYCRRLRAELDRRAPGRPPGVPRGGLLLVEKILAPGEPLRTDWAVDGSTGYDFMDQLGSLLHDPSGEQELDGAWHALGGEGPFAALALQARRETLGRSFAADFERALLRSAALLPDADQGPLDQALRALLVHLPVYRTYIGDAPCGTLDRALLHSAADAARDELEPAATQLLEALLPRLCGSEPVAPAPRAEALAALQQLSPPIAAKAVEDTAFYRYGRLLSRNEVGSDPGLLARTPAAFHGLCVQRARAWPRALLATATHDHKRGEDARARLAVLSECAGWWAGQLQDWLQRIPVGWQRGRPLPHAEDRAMLLQTLLGAWPAALAPDDAGGVEALRERVAGWQRKALREAKRRSSWSAPDVGYEGACAAFLQAWLDDRDCRAALHAAMQRIAPAGALNGLVQALLRCTAPGIPDLYQGTELWDHSLVDPDNRRPVDHALRARALAGAAAAASLLADWPGGRIKLLVLARALAARRACPALFGEGAYLPLPAQGRHAGRVFAFLRRHAGSEALVVVPLHAVPLLAGTPQVPPAAWGDTAVQLPGRSRGFRDQLANAPVELHDRTLPLARVLHDWPVALWLRN